MKILSYTIKLVMFVSLSFLSVNSCAQDIPENRPKVLNEAFDQEIAQTISFTIPTIGVEELHTQMQEEDIVLLDARKLKEYKTSHLPGAKHIGFLNIEQATLETIPKDSKIVLYCSIGYRSEKVAEKLQEQGYTNVQNLYGSIFEWVNQGHEVVNQKEVPTSKVHTYNKKWSQWVDNEEVKKVF